MLDTAVARTDFCELTINSIVGGGIIVSSIATAVVYIAIVNLLKVFFSSLFRRDRQVL